MAILYPALKVSSALILMMRHYMARAATTRSKVLVALMRSEVLAARINYMVAMAMIISAVMKAMISFSGGEVQTG
jgi:hypothetical protein